MVMLITSLYVLKPSFASGLLLQSFLLKASLEKDRWWRDLTVRRDVCEGKITPSRKVVGSNLDAVEVFSPQISFNINFNNLWLN